MKKILIKGFPIIKGKVRDGAIIEIPVPAELNECTSQTRWIFY